VNIQRQWKGRTHGGSFGQKALFFLFRNIRLSLLNAVLYPVLGVVIIFYLIFSHKGSKSIWFYYRVIQRKSILGSLLRAYKNHFIYGQNLFDKFALFAGNKNNFKVTITGQELFDEVIDSEKGAIIASSHVGNFEISGYLLKQEKKRINGIIYSQENPVIQQYRNKILEENNVGQIPVLPDMSHIFIINNVLQKGQIVTMPCDRVYTGNKTQLLDFMGHKANFPTGAYHLAVKFNVPVLSLFVMKSSYNNYHIYLSRLDKYSIENVSDADKISIMATNFAAELEKILRIYPDQWYNYYKFWN
jgi:predicted LPLAT superfamily acyltransferase